MYSVKTPVAGRIIKQENLGDYAFSSGAMGPCVGIAPTSERVVAPFDGVVKTIFPTKHALVVISDDGVQLLIHIGIDTVKLDGKGFKSKVNDGDTVKTGQLLVEFSTKKIEKAGYSTETPVIVINHKDYKSIEFTTKTEVAEGDEIIFIEK